MALPPAVSWTKFGEPSGNFLVGVSPVEVENNNGPQRARGGPFP
jgi:hypothetical protein